MGSDSRLRYWIKQLGAYGSFTLALLLILSNSISSLQDYHLNVTIDSDDGRVALAPRGHTLRSGDMILSVDGVSIDDFADYDPVFQNSPSSEIQLEFLRNGEFLSGTTPRVRPTYLPIIFANAWISITAFIYLASAVSLYVYGYGDKQGITGAYLPLAVGMGLMISGMFSRQLIGSLLGAYAAWFVFPAFAHLQVEIAPSQFPRTRIRWLQLVYAVASLGYILSVLTMINFHQVSQSHVLSSILSGTVVPFWAIGWCIVGFVWMRKSYNNTMVQRERRMLGVLQAAMSVSMGIPLTLSLIPSTLFDRPLLNFDLSFAFLFVLPAAFWYVVREYKLIRLERYASRAATVLLSLSLTVLLYTAIVLFIHEVLQVDPAGSNFLLNAALIVVPAVVFDPLRRRVQRWFDRLVYGGWYDLRSVVSSVSESIQDRPNLQELAESLSETLWRTMRVRWVGILVADYEQGSLIPLAMSGDREPVEWFEEINIPLENPTATALLSIPAAIRRKEVESEADHMGRTVEMEKLLEHERLQLIAPLHNDALDAVLVLGTRYGGEPFGDADLDIIQIVAHQTGIALANAMLVEQLAESLKDNEQYQRRLLSVREDEQKRIAREVHDVLIQSMVAFRYRLSEIQNGFDLHPESVKIDLGVYELQSEMGDLIRTARHICHELRPAALDLGLLPALRSVLDPFLSLAEPTIDFHVGEMRSDSAEKHTDSVILCLMRCLQESLTNIQKHAQATNVIVHITEVDHILTMKIEDDGVGFTVPNSLGELMRDQHYGLVGMRERVHLLRGTFEITSQPGFGSRLVINLPTEKDSLRDLRK